MFFFLLFDCLVNVLKRIFANRKAVILCDINKNINIDESIYKEFIKQV